MKKPQNKLIQKLLSNSITILFIAFLIWYFANNHEALKDLTSIPVWAFLALLFTKAVRIFLNGMFTKYTLDAFGKTISTSETNRLSLLSAMGNFFGPILGGAGVRAVYLKKYHDFQYSNFISTLYAYYLISFLSNSLLAILLMIYIIMNRGIVQGSIPITLVFIGIFIVCGGLMLLPVQISRRLFTKSKYIPGRFKNIASNIITGWEIMRGNKKLIIELSLLNYAGFIVGALVSWVLFALFVEVYSLVAVLMYTLIGTLAILINITPGAIGIKEGLFLFSLSIILLTPEQILQMSIIDRASTFVLLGLLFVISKFLFRGKQNKSI